MKTLDINTGIGTSIVEYPELVRVYMTYGVDFCCGGQRSVTDAIKEDAKNYDETLKSVLEAVERHVLDEKKSSEYGQLSKPALINEIIKTHHEFLREEMPLISGLLFKLLRVHSANHPELKKLHKTFNLLRIELEAHLVVEEVELFPLILDGKLEEAQMLEAVISDHDAAGEILFEMLEITDHFALPDDACTTYRLCYEKLESFIADMYMHVHKENNVLFI